MTRRIWNLLTGALLLAAAGCTGCGTERLEPEAFGQRMAADTQAVLVDVRQPAEYAEGHLHGALLMDWLDTAAFARTLATLDASKTYYVYCQRGVRSRKAAARMQKEGLNVVELKGGYAAWAAAGRPTERP